MLNFNFAGKNSFDDYGIYIYTRPSIPSPKRRINNVVIPGRSSSLKVDENAYDDITLAIECSIKGELLPEQIDNIKGWLIGAGERELVFSFQQDKKYVAQVVNSIDFSQVLKRFSKFVIVFNCQPFKYAVNNEPIDLLKGTKVINPGSIYSEPIIKIIGSGDIILNVNSESISLKEIDGEVIIDSVQQNCYNSQLENLNNKMSGEFPILNTGEINITWSGNISNLEVTPNWRWL